MSPFIPCCIGSAVYGRYRCTCDSPKVSIEERVTKLEKQIKDLIKQTKERKTDG